MKFVVAVTVRLSVQINADSERQAMYRAEKASCLMFDAVNNVWCEHPKPLSYPGWFNGYRTQSLFHKARSERGTLDLYSSGWAKADKKHLLRCSSPVQLVEDLSRPARPNPVDASRDVSEADDGAQPASA